MNGREHKYRVWDKANKVMVYFDFGSIDDGITFAGGNVVDIIDNEVMDFTGLKDRNGKEIYEGDIVSLNGGKPHKVYDRLGCWFIEWVAELGYQEQSIVEVIGNIYENPELLNVN